SHLGHQVHRMSRLRVNLLKGGKMSHAASPPGWSPGWYPDPAGQPFQRWWNGTTWTTATYPYPQTPSTATAPTSPNPAMPPPVQPLASRRVVSARTQSRVRQLAWASVPVWSLGSLAFAPFLRLAIVRRRAKDWGVFVAYLAAVAVEIILDSVIGPNG